MASKTVKGSSVGCMLDRHPSSLMQQQSLMKLPGSGYEEDDDETDAASSLMIMALGAEQGDEVTVTQNAEAEKIAALIEQDLDAKAFKTARAVESSRRNAQPFVIVAWRSRYQYKSVTAEELSAPPRCSLQKQVRRLLL